MSATDATADPPRPEPAVRERMAPADAAWWRMEEADNQMVIAAVLTFAEPLDVARLTRIVQTKLLAYARFRQRVEDPASGVGLPRWVPDDDFSLDRHLRRVTLSPPGDEPALAELVGRLTSEPLDHAHPLWRIHYVERVGAGSAVVVRVHHCIADGLALVRLLLRLDDVVGNEDAAPWPGAGGIGLAAEPLCDGRVARIRARAGRMLARAGVGLAAFRSLGRLVATRSDARSVYRGPLGHEKRVAWSASIPLPDVKRAARSLGASINDVMCAAVAHGLAGYSSTIADRRLRRVHAIVPVNLRRPHSRWALGNRFGIVFLRLPVASHDAQRRLDGVKREMGRLKRSAQAGVTYALLQLFGCTTAWLVKLAVRYLARGASLVLTNVPGPREPVWFCGARVGSIMAWVPQSGRLAVGVSVLSYDGHVRVGVSSDGGLLPDPERLVAAIESAVHEMIGTHPERVVPLPAKVERRPTAVLPFVAPTTDVVRRDALALHPPA